MEKLRKLNILGADNQVYNVIKDSIVTLRLKPNQYLNIRKISQQLGTSITPVRSALQRLANEGREKILRIVSVREFHKPY